MTKALYETMGSLVRFVRACGEDAGVVIAISASRRLFGMVVVALLVPDQMLGAHHERRGLR